LVEREGAARGMARAAFADRSRIGHPRADRAVLELAQPQYCAGLGDFLTALNAERALSEHEGQLAQSRTGVITGLVLLKRAVGRGQGLRRSGRGEFRGTRFALDLSWHMHAREFMTHSTHRAIWIVSRWLKRLVGKL
jgi:hypothetical protein